MSVLEVKNDLFRLVVETEDINLLEKVRTYFKGLRNEPISKEELEEQEARLVEIGLKQIEDGQVMTHEEARKKINERLYKNQK